MSKCISESISKFLDIYEQYELLWNTRLQNYMSKRKRESAFQKLVSVITKHGLGHFTYDMLTKRIKPIRTVYRTELMNVIKSTKSGASPKKFTNQDTHDVTGNRKSMCNLVSAFKLKMLHLQIFRTHLIMHV